MKRLSGRHGGIFAASLSYFSMIGSMLCMAVIQLAVIWYSPAMSRQSTAGGAVDNRQGLGIHFVQHGRQTPLAKSAARLYDWTHVHRVTHDRHVRVLTEDKVAAFTACLDDDFCRGESAIRNAVGRRCCLELIHQAALLKVDVLASRRHPLDNGSLR